MIHSQQECVIVVPLDSVRALTTASWQRAFARLLSPHAPPQHNGANSKLEQNRLCYPIYHK
jgi:hypothetical protein